MPNTVQRTLQNLAVLLALAAVGPALAQQEPRLPGAPAQNLPAASKPTPKFPGTGLTGAGGIVPRVSVDQNEMPWRAIGRLQAGRASCTGALVGPALLMTAAHCVFDPRTRRLFPPQDIHFKLGYSEGRYTAEARGTRVTVAERYDPTQGIGTMGDDWALVELDQPIGIPDRVLRLRTRALAAGDVVALGGYARERIEVLMVDAPCRVVGSMSDKNGVGLFRHDCTATQGVSGAPLLIEDGAEWLIGAIEVVGAPNAGGGAAALDDARTAMERLSK